MSKCNVCDLQFRSIGALEQHERDSSKHATGVQMQQHRQDRNAPPKIFTCVPCGRHFRTIDSLQQHAEATRHHAAEVLQRSAPGPSSLAVKLECGTCKRQFDNSAALSRHQKDLPSHMTKALQYGAQDSTVRVTLTHCDPCGRQFASVEALQQHKQDSPAHATPTPQEFAPRDITTPSTVPTRSTVGLESGSAHRRQRSTRRQQGSTRRAMIFPCSLCNQSFSSDNALQAHKQSSHTLPENSPWSMHPDLHDEVSQRLEANGLSVEFYEEGEIEDSIRDYDTNIMGAFTCPNQSCPVQRWTSKRVAISIQLYDDEQYNAIVWHQRCQECDSVGSLELDVQSYTDRVVYRLGKWLGLQAPPPPFSGSIQGPAHKQELCEGCKSGHCQKGYPLYHMGH
jgi:DNA-directed RNA polymerase subunit M/transcription elongation factor TFIIS